MDGSKLTAEMVEHQSGRSAERKSAPRPWWEPCRPKTAFACSGVAHLQLESDYIDQEWVVGRLERKGSTQAGGVNGVRQGVSGKSALIVPLC